MYLAHYGLSQLPFQISPDARFFFESRGHKRARATIIYGLSKSEGFVIVTGAVGAGKTTLLEHLLTSGHFEDAVVARISTTQLGSENLLQLIGYSLNLPSVADTKAGVLRDLKRFLEDSARRGQRVLLIVDEVQNLSRESLEELRMLSNFQDSSDALLQMILVGQPEFRERLASPDCEQIRQRVIASYHLEALALDDVPDYIQHRLVAAGAGGRMIFDARALERIAYETGGVPRKINRLCDRLLLYGYLEDTTRIDAAAVEEVAEEMRRESLEPDVSPAPAPASASAPATTGGNGAPPAGPNADAGTNAQPNGAMRPTVAAGAAAPSGNGAAAPAGLDCEALTRTIADLRRDLAAYRRKMGRIRDLIAREQERLRPPSGRS